MKKSGNATYTKFRTLPQLPGSDQSLQLRSDGITIETGNLRDVLGPTRSGLNGANNLTGGCPALPSLRLLSLPRFDVWCRLPLRFRQYIFHESLLGLQLMLLAPKPIAGQH